MNNLVNPLNYNNLTGNQEIQLISNTSKLQSKFQSEINQIILRNKIIFQNFGIESKLQSDKIGQLINSCLNKTIRNKISRTLSITYKKK